nr:MAG TPA: hypothetical protein [Caudoviricetes sp.]
MPFLIFITLLIHLMVPFYVIDALKNFMNTKNIKYLYWKIMYSFIIFEMIILCIYGMTQVYNEFTELVWKTKN